MSGKSDKPSLFSIYLSFAKMGAVLIGGGYALLPILENEVVKRRGWTKTDEMADLYALSQLLPGVIALNTSMLVGQRLRGVKGNLAAAFGLVTVPFALMAAYAILYGSASEMELFANVLKGLRPAAAGMVLGMGMKMFAKTAKNRPAGVFAACVCAFIVFFNPPVVALILATVLAGIGWNAFSVSRKHRR